MKKTASVIFALILVLFSVVSVSAKSILNYGDWTVTFSDGDDLAFTIDSCRVTDSQIVVPDSFGGIKIVQIGPRALMNNDTVSSIELNEYIYSIGEYAFLNCSGLTRMTLTSSVTEIGASAFSGTASLKEINLEDTGVTVIETNTFLNSGIEKIVLPSTCTELKDSSFAQCDRLSRIVIPNSITTIHDNAFRSSDNLTIYCYTDSYAHQYAVSKDIPYVLLDAPITFILGDADGDGSITVLDATKIQRVLVDLDDDPDGMIALRGAVDGEKLNVMHATSIQRYLADYYTAEPIGTEVTRTLG